MKLKRNETNAQIIHSKVHEHQENNQHDHVVIRGLTGDEKDDQIVNANCKIIFVTQFLKQCKLVPYDSFHRILPEADEFCVELISQNGQLVGLNQLTGKRDKRLLDFMDTNLYYYLLLGTRREWNCIR